MPKYLLAHDLGTSGNKATLFTTRGARIKSKTYRYSTRFAGQGRAEQNPEDWWKAVVTTTRELAAEVRKEDILAVSFSGQMMGCLCVDKNGLPLHDSMIWADTRSVAEERFLKEKIEPFRIYSITGQQANAGCSLEKLLWIKNNRPEVYRNTYKMLNAKDYIVLRMTGKFLTDYSDASETNAFDLNSFRWSEEIIDAAGIAPDLLPDVRPSTYVAGGLLRGAAEECGLSRKTLVVLGGGDGACATVGAGSVSEGTTYNCLGSSSWISTTSKKQILDAQMRTFNFAHLIPGYICPCGTMQAAGASYEWMKEQLCGYERETAGLQGKDIYSLIDTAIGKSPAGAKGLIYLPYLLGERSPRWNPRAKGAFVGLTMSHTHEDMVRSVVEGIGLNLRLILDVLRGHYRVERIFVLGGLAKSKEVCQILADIYGTELLPLDHPDEATSIGAAAAAGVAVGALESFAEVKRFTKPAAGFVPGGENSERYNRALEIFDHTYEALTGIFEELA